MTSTGLVAILRGIRPDEAVAVGRVLVEEGIDAMRRIKQAIDPEWKLSPGVLFPRQV